VDTYEYLLLEIHKEVESIEIALSNGKAKDYAEYQYLCGKIRGLLIAQSKITDLKERMEKDDE
jgi:hypothetical protein